MVTLHTRKHPTIKSDKIPMNTIYPSMIIYSFTGGMILFNALRYLSLI